MKPQTQTLRYADLGLARLAMILFSATVLALWAMAAAAAPQSFADLAERVSPSVVNITTKTEAVADGGEQGLLPPGSPFEDLFREFQERRGAPAPGPRRGRPSTALGSGFVISADGFVVTNNHVIENADEIMIEFTDGKELEATLIGTDPKTDIALLKVSADADLPFVTLGDSDKARIGDWVLAVGNPLGQGFSVSAGIVSQRGRALSGAYDDYIQTDAAINRGNSGGPLFNMDGQVIGVNTAILSPNGGSIGIGFSMASNVVKKVVAQLQEYGETRRGWLGVRIQDVTPDVADAIGLDRARGALVSDVMDGPSQAAGMRAGDVILRFDGVEISDTRSLVATVGDAEVGKRVEVEVWRDGKSETLTVRLGRREDAERAMPQDTSKNEPVQKQTGEILGLSLRILDDEVRQGMGLPDDMTGLLVENVDEASEAFEKGVRAGDIIAEAGQLPVDSIDDLQSRIDQAKAADRGSILILIRRGTDPRFIALSLQD